MFRSVYSPTSLFSFQQGIQHRSQVCWHLQIIVCMLVSNLMLIDDGIGVLVYHWNPLKNRKNTL